MLLGLFGFVVSLVALSRMKRRIVEPLLELYRVAKAAKQGDRQVRCHLAANAPSELGLVIRSYNDLLDRSM